MIYSSGAVGSDWPWERWMAQIRSLVSRHLCHPVLCKQTIRSCSARTFWKVAVFPCAGVLAPVCSCWHSTASFSISVTTEDFSSSTSWNREKSRAGDAFQDKREGAIHVCVCVGWAQTQTDLPDWIYNALVQILFTKRVKEGWNKFRFSVVRCNPSAKARSWSAA